MLAYSQMWHSGWSWSDQIKFHQTAGIAGAWMLSKRMCSKLVQWCYLVHVSQGQLSKTVRLLLQHSIQNIPSHGPIICSVHVDM